jgi:hypothetical protein
MSAKSIQSKGITAPATSPAPDATHKRLSRLEDRLNALLAETDKGLPVWIRAPKTNKVEGESTAPEHYSGLSRTKLYALAAARDIRSVSLREPGQLKGTRLFHLASILAFIEKNEAGAAKEGGK